MAPKLIILLAVVAAVACATPLRSDDEYRTLFRAFIQQFDKTYARNEYSQYFRNFVENLDMIETHNAQHKSWTMSMNEFGDLSFEQFKANYLGYRHISRPYLRSKNVAVQEENAKDLPVNVDWRTKNAVTPVKNQGNCGSCWAFSTTGSLEGALALKFPSSKIVSLSEQQLVDCATAQGNQGCNGGLMDDAFEYVKAQGLCTEEAYPYKEKDGKCTATKCKSVVSITGYVDVQASNETALKIAVAKQPVSVAIEADQMGFQFYSGGVFDGECGTQLDHGVLVAGYGVEEGKPYWLVKNSWGPTWGDKGYIKLVRKETSELSDGQCGITLAASYPTM